MHECLLHAYFAENRDITNADTLLALWREVGLDDPDFARAGDDAVLREVVDQHNDAVRRDVSGVPAVMMAGIDVPIVGAQPYETYRRWVERRLEAKSSACMRGGWGRGRGAGGGGVLSASRTGRKRRNVSTGLSARHVRGAPRTPPPPAPRPRPHAAWRCASRANTRAH